MIKTKCMIDVTRLWKHINLLFLLVFLWLFLLVTLAIGTGRAVNETKFYRFHIKLHNKPALTHHDSFSSSSSWHPYLSVMICLPSPRTRRRSLHHDHAKECAPVRSVCSFRALHPFGPAAHPGGPCFALTPLWPCGRDRSWTLPQSIPRFRRLRAVLRFSPAEPPQFDGFRERWKLKKRFQINWLVSKRINNIVKYLIEIID